MRPPKFCITFVFHFSWLLGITAVSKEIENNAYAKFWGAKKVHYGKCGSGVCHNNRNRDPLVNVCHSENYIICICMNTGDINSDLSKRPPRRPTVKGFATLQLKINSRLSKVPKWLRLVH